MDTSVLSSPINAYWSYFQQNGASLQSEQLDRLNQDLASTVWDNPESTLDLNNFAVIALIEAEQTEDLSIRAINFDIALQALTAGVEQQSPHPLCIAHLALARCMIGEVNEGINFAFSRLIETLHPAYTTTEPLPLGLVYLPPDKSNRSIAQQEHLYAMLQAKDGYTQALLLMVWTLCRYQLVFYGSNAVRFMQLALQLLPESTDLHLKLGLTQVMNQQWEGLLHLQQARQLAPNYSNTLQSLYLSYRELQRIDAANFWLQSARTILQRYPQAADWQWARLQLNSPFTYVPFDTELVMAVEPRLRSIVTTILLGEGDWFEAEMEFWRAQLQPGMTVIDVGANVGVYTFSAAQQVGASGRVFAVEPFSSCVQCLKETCRVNQLDWVTVCAGAASDRPGTAKLSLHGASELNEVIRDDTPAAGTFEEIACFTLDSLIDQENIQRVDWLKIDAEGHEMQVLAGSSRILKEFKPRILYENIAGAKGSNIPVAEFLQAQGYQLFRYQPFLQELIPIESVASVQGNLNIIALPADL